MNEILNVYFWVNVKGAIYENKKETQSSEVDYYDIVGCYRSTVVKLKKETEI